MGLVDIAASGCFRVSSENPALAPGAGEFFGMGPIGRNLTRKRA